MSAGIPFGNYRLIRRIARGGMAEVFLATQQGPSGFERAVAVKRILPHLADDPQFVEMFMDEARLAAQLSHPNVAHIYEFGRVEDSYFIAMEYIDGIDLSAVILDGPKRPIPLELAARIVGDVCAALHCAHSLTGKNNRPIDLVHRDISPQNILVSFGGSVKVVDFGIAKAAIHIERTRPGVVRGKYTYMSPEQVDGKVLDGRADLFCAGIVLYELCTCEALFPRTDPVQAMRRIRAGDIPRPLRAGAPLPAHLEKILLRALAKKREERYRNAAEMQMDLEAFLRTVPQIVSSIVLGEYFTKHYRQLRPQPDAEGGEGAKERTLGVIRALAPGTAPIDAARRNPPSPEARTIALSDEQARVRREDFAATQVRPAPSGASGTIHGMETALKSVPSENAETPEPLLVEPSERETIAFDPPPVPRDLSASAVRGEIDAQSTLVPTHDATPPGITVDPAVGRPIEPETIVPGLGSTGGAFRQVAMTRAPDAVRGGRPRFRSIGRRLLVIGLIALVAGVGVAAGYWLSEPPGLPAASIRGDATARLADHPAAIVQAHDAAPSSRPAAVEGTLEINSRPEGATINVDGIEVQGTTPLRRSFFAGSHTIVASYPGFEDRAQKVRLEPDQTLTVNLTLRRLQPEQIVTLKREEDLKPKTVKKVRPKGKKKAVAKGAEPPPSGGHGYLTIATTPWSSVFLGEKKLGITPFANVKVPAGRHTLRFTNAKGASVTRVVTVRSDQVTKLSFALPGT